jgi:mannose-1-phosphate guanylyltransferase
MVAKPKEFRKVVKKAVALARRKVAIVTIGIKPDYPATCFGYISPKTRAFVEKPDAEKAKKYVKAGYLWNAGMFIARASVFRGAFAAHAPELEKLANIGVSAKSIAPAGLARLYAALPKISFDYAVMEALSREGGVGVVPGDFGWDDVGGYGAFDRYYPHDANGNVADGRCAIVDGRDLICVSKGPRVAVMGVSGLVVVATKDAVLVTCKSRVGELKKLVAAAQ